MNTKPATSSPKVSNVPAIGVLILLLGTATGNAFAMLAMALVALALTPICCRHELRQSSLLAMALAAGTATAAALLIARFYAI